MINRIARFLCRLARSTRGNACIEAAIALPVFASLILGGVDGTRLVLAGQKSERAAASIADLVSQAKKLKESDVTDLFNIVTQVMSPFATGDHIRVIVTCINNPAGTAKVAWQRTWGSATATSTIGAAGATAATPGGLIVRTGETALIAEVYYTYDPLFVPQVFPASTLYRWSVFRPRFANLDTIYPG